MAVQSTLLSVIISRMQRKQALNRVETQFLVRDLDEAIRESRRTTQLPWTLQKGSLKVFKDVLEYPIATDHDELAYLDSSKADSFFPASARFKFTSLQEFYENPDYRNDLAEIRDANDIFLGVRYLPENLTQTLLNNAETAADFSVSGDATSVTKDTVTFKRGNASMRIAITLSASTATIKNTFSSFTDSEYKKKYHFKWVYLDAVPTSISLRFQVDDSNYLQTTGITTQFSGQPFKADQWNLVAHDLNTATATGTISTSSVWASEKIILVGAATGTYYVDESNLREWALMDYWYYSRNNVALVGSTTANQEYFYNSSEVYSTDSKLVGDSEWIDYIMYRAEITALTDLKEWDTLKEVKINFTKAAEMLAMTYPSMKPLVITNRYRMTTDFNQLEHIHDS